ncbi:hypothetical protein CCH79_00009546 [Gambusia affinis]|uniref:Protein kinase domain-containing protein n=1 Tax=Gambusia affinis TaxID=33528 RepID=A0A315VDX8_GAMAF|nr:hypothetical protein CCH79_00009546 [Gambusia affinis]
MLRLTKDDQETERERENPSIPPFLHPSILLFLPNQILNPLGRLSVCEADLVSGSVCCQISQPTGRGREEFSPEWAGLEGEEAKTLRVKLQSWGPAALKPLVEPLLHLDRIMRLCGFEPFFDPRGDQYMYSRILNCDYEFVSPWWDDVSLNAKDLVSKLIVLDPHKRLSVREALQHPWVLGKAARFSHMDTTQRKLQEFNARRKLKAAMKAVVATSRMHEGSRRRTDSCEMPGSGTSRQSSMQQDPPPESAGSAPDEKEAPPPDQQVPQNDESTLANQSAASPSPPCSPNPPSSEAPPTGPVLVRPPLRTDGLRQASVIPKSMLVQPRLPQKSCSVIESVHRGEATPPLGSPSSPNNLSNGFTPGAEPGTKAAPCQ